MQEEALSPFVARKGHFLFESGHHGDLWLDLELLCLRPQLVKPAAAKLADSLRRHNIEVVCGPLVEGAFVAFLVASELGADFTYSERFFRPVQEGLFPAGYRIPNALRSSVRGKRVAIVNDAINAGSAVRGTFADLLDCGATVAAIGSLLVLGRSAFEFAASKNIVLESLAILPNNLWNPVECSLCAGSVPLEDVAGFRAVHPRPL